MSLNQIFACSLIMKELFGEVVEKVGTYLIKKGPMPRGLIVQDTELNVEQVGLYHLIAKVFLTTLLSICRGVFHHTKTGFEQLSMSVFCDLNTSLYYQCCLGPLQTQVPFHSSFSTLKPVHNLMSYSLKSQPGTRPTRW